MKCHRHVMNAKKDHKSCNKATKRKADRVGLDHPLPARRAHPIWHEHVEVATEARRTVQLPPGSALARRFPHLVRKAQEDTKREEQQTNDISIVEATAEEPARTTHLSTVPRDAQHKAVSMRTAERRDREQPFARKRVAFRIPPHSQRGGPTKGSATEGGCTL